MLPKKRRLKRVLAKKALKQGKKIEGDFFNAKYFFSLNQESVFTVVISSKIAKKAVFRNKIKRKVRAVIEKLLPRVKEGFLILIFLKKNVFKLKFQELEAEILKFFKKSGLIKI